MPILLKTGTISLLISFPLESSLRKMYMLHLIFSPLITAEESEKTNPESFPLPLFTFEATVGSGGIDMIFCDLTVFRAGFEVGIGVTEDLKLEPTRLTVIVFELTASPY